MPKKPSGIGQDASPTFTGPVRDTIHFNYVPREPVLGQEGTYYVPKYRTGSRMGSWIFLGLIVFIGVGLFMALTIYSNYQRINTRSTPQTEALDADAEFLRNLQASDQPQE